MADPEDTEVGQAGSAGSGEETETAERPDHEFEVLEDDQTVPPRPEEVIADAESGRAAQPGG